MVRIWYLSIMLFSSCLDGTQVAACLKFVLYLSVFVFSSFGSFCFGV